MRTHNIPPCYRKIKDILILHPDLALLSTLIGSNYPSRTNFHGPYGVRANEVRLYFPWFSELRFSLLSRLRSRSETCIAFPAAALSAAAA